MDSVNQFQDRIESLVYMRVGDLCKHPHNYKDHGQEHSLILSESLKEFGVIKPLMAYRSERMKGKLTLLDGHGRMKVNPDEVWPVVILDIDDDEADSLLLIVDTIGDLAEKLPEPAALLAAKADIESPALLQYVQEYADSLRKAPFAATGWMTLKIRVPSDLKQLWAMHLVAHSGDEVAAFENLLAQSDPTAYLDLLDQRDQEAVKASERALHRGNKDTESDQEDSDNEQEKTPTSHRRRTAKR